MTNSRVKESKKIEALRKMYKAAKTDKEKKRVISLCKINDVDLTEIL